MKKIILLFCALPLHLVTTAQQKAKAPANAKPAATPVNKVPSVPVLRTAMDSLSYCVGMLDGKFFATQGVEKVNGALLGRGFEDAIAGKTLLTPEEADQYLRTEMQKMSRRKVQPEIDKGQAFLAENAKRKEVKQTRTGLQYEVLKEGNGPRPVDTSVVVIHYEGFLLNGRKFDSSRDRGEPTTYPLNRFIKGWIEGLQLMQVGSRYKFYVPYQLAYGEQGAGADIPGGAVLIFDVELLDITKNQ